MTLVTTILLLAALGTDTTAIQITSAKLVEIYARDSLAADTRFKGSRLHVTGIVAKEPKLYMRSPMVTFQSTEYYNRPVAVLDPSRKNEMVNVREGQTITLACFVSGHVAGTPTLRDCTLVQAPRASGLAR